MYKRQDQEYEREDGTKGSGFTITKAFDISQTRGQQPLPSQQRLPEEIIAALVEQSPVPLAISDQLPQGVQAQYVPKQRTIYVRNGMDETATICAIAREQAHAGFDTVMEYIKIINPEHAVINHMATECDYNTINLQTPDFVEPAYDGLTITLDDYKEK